jgi:hypothetical protein
LTASINGLDFDVNAYVLDKIGESENGDIDIIIGALTMEMWWIKIDPKKGTLDISHLKKREFTEF